MSALKSAIDECNSAKLIISVDGRLDYNLRKQFRDAFTNTSNDVTQFEVDLAKTTYIDSSGLGLLLILKEHADTLGGKVNINKPNPEVKELLELSNFTQLFEIKE